MKTCVWGPYPPPSPRACGSSGPLTWPSTCPHSHSSSRHSSHTQALPVLPTGPGPLGGGLGWEHALSAGGAKTALVLRMGLESEHLEPRRTLPHPSSTPQREPAWPSFHRHAYRPPRNLGPLSTPDPSVMFWSKYQGWSPGPGEPRKNAPEPPRTHEVQGLKWGHRIAL